MKIDTIALVVFGGLALQACAPDVGLGDTVRHNMALQVIDPDPEYRGTPMEGGSGIHSAAAVDRYNKGQVKDPKPPRGASAFRDSDGGNSGNPLK